MQFTVKNRICTTDSSSLIGDNADYTANFSFDSEWDGVTKTARFLSKENFTDVILSNDSCTIPALKQSITEIGVYCANMTTTPCRVYIQASIKESGAQASPEETVYEQILSRLDELEVSTVSDEAIATAVSAYLADNPIETLTEDDVETIVTTLLQNMTVGDANVQADWNQSDNNADDYIKNKPESLPASDVYEWAKQSEKPSYNATEVGALPSDTQIPTKTSDLTNDSNFISNTVNNLTNYYKKTETYTQTEVNNLIGAINTLTISVVQALPESNISTTTIYLIEKTTAETNNTYDEYIYTNNSWELIGSTSIDLTDYATKNYVGTAIENITIPTVTNDLTDELKTQYDNAVNDKHTHSNKAVLDSTTASFTSEEKEKLNDVDENANNYTLPKASNATLGGVKIGTGLSITQDGTLNASGGEGSGSTDYFVENLTTGVMSRETNKMSEILLSAATSVSNVAIVGRNMAKCMSVLNGSTWTSNNLVVDTPVTVQGITVTLLDNGKVKLAGTSTGALRIVFGMPSDNNLVGKRLRFTFGNTLNSLTSGIKLATNIYYQTGYKHNMTTLGTQTGLVAKAGNSQSCYIDIPSGKTIVEDDYFVMLEMTTEYNKEFLSAYQAPKMNFVTVNTTEQTVENISSYGDVISIISPSDISMNTTWTETVLQHNTYLLNQLKQKDKLYGKTVYCIGDSLCVGQGYQGGYCAVLAETNHDTRFINKGIGNASFADNGNGTSYNISSQVSALADMETLPDIVLIEGGINDYLNQNIVGTITEDDFTTVPATTTTAGAFENLIQTLISTYPSIKLGFMTTHYYSTSGKTTSMKNYMDILKQACEKWGIPCLDLFTSGGINARTGYGAVYYSDYIHYNEAGYRRITPIIEEFLKTRV